MCVCVCVCVCCAGSMNIEANHVLRVRDEMKLNIVIYNIEFSGHCNEKVNAENNNE